jgi:hypothetical protein
MNLRDKILSAVDVQEEILEIKEWGEKVKIKGVTAADRARILQKSIDIESKSTDFFKLTALTVIYSTYDPETDKRLFNEKDINALMQKAAKPIEKISQIANKLSGISEEAKEEAKND